MCKLSIVETIFANKRRIARMFSSSEENPLRELMYLLPSPKHLKKHSINILNRAIERSHDYIGIYNTYVFEEFAKTDTYSIEDDIDIAKLFPAYELIPNCDDLVFYKITAINGEIANNVMHLMEALHNAAMWVDTDFFMSELNYNEFLVGLQETSVTDDRGEWWEIADDLYRLGKI